MTWSIVRKATDEDRGKLEARAQAFCKRHSLESYEGDTAVMTIEYIIDGGIPIGEVLFEYYDLRCLEKLWLRVVRRALGGQYTEGIAYGHVGFEVE